MNKLKSLFYFLVASVSLQTHAQQSQENFQTSDKLHLVQPNYDFSVGGGLIVTTTDNSYFVNYYSSLPIFHGDVSISRIFWINNVGISIGLLGRYGGIIGPSVSASATDPSIQTQNQFFTIMAEGITGVRYRNPRWTYLQPGVFAGVGASYFNEKATITSSTSSQTTYSTQWSPVVEAGAHLDLSYTALTTNPNEIQGDIPQTVQDVLFRFSGAYLFNPVQTIPSLSGCNLQVALVFLIQ